MIPRRITNHTHNLGAPDGWNEKEAGKCISLAVRVVGEPKGGNGFCESAWEPTPAELDAIKKGGSIILRIWGWQPPVSIYTERVETGEKVEG